MFLLYDDNGKEINRKYSTKDTSNPPRLTQFRTSRMQSTETLLNVNGKNSFSQLRYYIYLASY